MEFAKCHETSERRKEKREAIIMVSRLRKQLPDERMMDGWRDGVKDEISSLY